MLCILALSLTASVLMPSSKTIAMMVIIPKLAESKALQQDIPELYDLALKSLKEQITPKTPSK